MKHRKYERIEGTWHEKTMEYFKEQGFFAEDIEWCVMEKVHGCNFAFYLDQEEVKVGKRKHFLIEGENFYQYLRMSKREQYKCVQIWDDIVSGGLEIKELIIYGELFGGFYPHPDVQNIGSVRKVQKGVWYHPDIQFYAFDIWIKTDTFSGFLDYDLAIDLFKKNDLLYAKIIKQGTYEECSQYPTEFQTAIPDLLGLPKIENNLCEGVVLKPILPIYMKDGDRVILKTVNEQFKVISREKGDEKLKRISQEMSEYAKETVELLIPYINENRLRSVLSKFGEFSKKDFNNVYSLFKEDIYEDFAINYDNLEFCDVVDLKMVGKEVGRLCVEIWRPIFLSEAI